MVPPFVLVVWDENSFFVGEMYESKPRTFHTLSVGRNGSRGGVLC